MKVSTITGYEYTYIGNNYISFEPTLIYLNRYRFMVNGLNNVSGIGQVIILFREGIQDTTLSQEDIIRNFDATRSIYSV
jgi:hypothetical protein